MAPLGVTGDDTPPAIRRLIVALVVSQGALFALLGLARFATYHNETFDLAFYARIAWGLTHGDHWEPIVNAHIDGLHLSPVLRPLGWLGRLFGTAPVLIVAQAAALAATAFPLARMGARHLGPAGALAGAIAWLFQPNLGHVAGYEAHPSSIAALPLAWIAWSIDRGKPGAFALASLGVLACREDLALVVLASALFFTWRHRREAKNRWFVPLTGIVALAHLLFFVLVLHPRHAPEHGSLELHFGRFGESASAVAIYLATHPAELARHLATPERLVYLATVLAPLALLPLLRPGWLLAASPVLAVNLVSDWPTTTSLDVHYLTPALPLVVAGALEAAGGMKRPLALVLVVAPALVAHLLAGGTPLSLDFTGHAFRPDANTAAARAIVAAIPADARVQAPDPLLAHLAERRVLRRAASPEAGARYLVLDVAHRRRFARREELLRTIEEPHARSWLAREDHALVLAAGDYLLLERDRDPRTGIGARAIAGRANPASGERLAGCLALLGAELRGEELTLELVARGPCPNDLALRIGTGRRPRRVDLPFGGLLSPHHLRSGDRLRSAHRLSAEELARIAREGLRVGALRSSGARPEHEDPISIAVEPRRLR